MERAAQPASSLTVLLQAWSEGDKSALDKLAPLIYDELRRLAKRYMSREKPSATMETGAFLNEAFQSHRPLLLSKRELSGLKLSSFALMKRVGSLSDLHETTIDGCRAARIFQRLPKSGLVWFARKFRLRM